MDPVAFRLKNLPAEAPNALWRKYYPSPRSASAGTGATQRVTRRRGRSSAASAARPIAGAVAAGAPRPTAKSTPTAASSCGAGTQDLGVGTKTLVAIITAETLGLPITAVKRRDWRQQLPVQRRQRRQHDRALGVAGHPRDRLPRARGAGRPRRARAWRAPPTSRGGGRGPCVRQGRRVEGARMEGGVQAARHRADCGQRRVAARAVGLGYERRADGRGRGGRRDGHHARDARRCACRTAGCRGSRSPPRARSTAASSAASASRCSRIASSTATPARW